MIRLGMRWVWQRQRQRQRRATRSRRRFQFGIELVRLDCRAAATGVWLVARLTDWRTAKSLECFFVCNCDSAREARQHHTRREVDEPRWC